MQREPWLQTPQQHKRITHRVQKFGENPFILGWFMFWKLQFPSKFVLHQKFKFAHLLFQEGEKKQ